MSNCRCFDTPSSAPEKIGFRQALEKCKCTCNARFSAEENGRKYTMVVTAEDALQKVDKIKIDGFLIPRQTSKKCDYLFLYKDKGNERLCFVELKGKNIEEAVKQIDQTVGLFKKERYLNENKKAKAFIVSSRYPAHDATFRKLKSRLETKYMSYGLTLRQKNKLIRYDPVQDKIL